MSLQNLIEVVVCVRDVCEARNGCIVLNNEFVRQVRGDRCNHLANIPPPVRTHIVQHTRPKTNMLGHINVIVLDVNDIIVRKRDLAVGVVEQLEHHFEFRLGLG